MVDRALTIRTLAQLWPSDSRTFSPQHTNSRIKVTIARAMPKPMRMKAPWESESESGRRRRRPSCGWLGARPCSLLKAARVVLYQWSTRPDSLIRSRYLHQGDTPTWEKLHLNQEISSGEQGSGEIIILTWVSTTKGEYIWRAFS